MAIQILSDIVAAVTTPASGDLLLIQNAGVHKKIDYLNLENAVLGKAWKLAGQSNLTSSLIINSGAFPLAIGNYGVSASANDSFIEYGDYGGGTELSLISGDFRGGSGNDFARISTIAGGAFMQLWSTGNYVQSVVMTPTGAQISSSIGNLNGAYYGADYSVGGIAIHGDNWIPRYGSVKVAGADTEIQYNNAGVFGADASFAFLGAAAGISIPIGTAAQRANTLSAIRFNSTDNQFEVRGSLLNQSSSYSRIGEHPYEMTVQGGGTITQSGTNSQSFNLSPFKSADGTIELRVKFIAYDSGNAVSFSGEYVALYKDVVSTASQIGTQQTIYEISDDGTNPPQVTLDIDAGSARIQIDFGNPVTPTRSYDFYYDGVFRYNKIKASA